MEKSDPKEDLKELAIWNALFQAMNRFIEEDLQLLQSITPLKMERLKPLSSGASIWVYLIIFLQLLMILLQIINV